MTEPTRRHDALALAILAALITISFADVLFGTNVLYIRDLSQYHYPGKLVLREIVQGGEFPHWNPWFGAGQPMAANPQHEVFYPLTWLILLPDYRFAFHLLILLHVYIAAFSMYALLRSMAMRPAAAFFGALSFALGGAGLSYLNLLPFLFAIAWLPLICLFARRFLRGGSRRAFALAALFFGIQLLLGEPTTILQTGVLLGVYGVVSAGRSHGARGAAIAIAKITLVCVAALLVSAVQMVPAIDHAADSVRARGFAFDLVADWSLPPIRLGELFHPNVLGHMNLANGDLYWGSALYGDRGGPFLISIYPGLLLSCLAMAGVLAGVRGRRTFLAIAALSVILALGDATPLWRVLFDAGVVRSLRYPEKFTLMLVFAVIVYGCRTLNAILSGDERTRRIAVRVGLGISTIALGAALFSLTASHARWFFTFWEPEERLAEAMLAASATGWLLMLARGGAVVLLLRNVTTKRMPAWLAVAASFFVLDLLPLLHEAAPRQPAEYYDPPALAKSLPTDRRPWRLFHHAAWHVRRPAVREYEHNRPDRSWIRRNGMFPMTPAQHGIRMALDDDYDLTALTPTADFVQSAADLSDLRRDWVDVVASMSNAWYRAVFLAPAETFAEARGNTKIVQPVGIIALEQVPRYRFAGHVEAIADRADFVRKVASNRFEKGTAFVRGQTFAAATGRVLSVRETANTARIAVETAGRAFLVISVTPHKYWRITIDGRDAQAVVTNIGYQGVPIPDAGRHLVEMRYRNPLFVPAGIVSVLSLIALAAIAVRTRT